MAEWLRIEREPAASRGKFPGSDWLDAESSIRNSQAMLNIGMAWLLRERISPP
jgi:hypothetical protein